VQLLGKGFNHTAVEFKMQTVTMSINFPLHQKDQSRSALTLSSVGFRRDEIGNEETEEALLPYFA
jgi:hypothetical protein